MPETVMLFGTWFAEVTGVRLMDSKHDKPPGVVEGPITDWRIEDLRLEPGSRTEAPNKDGIRLLPAEPPKE